VGTYLTNSKMSPELRARIEASVGGRSGAAPSRFTPGLRAGLRFVILLVMIGSVVALVLDWRRSRQQLQAARSALLDEAGQALAGLEPRDPSVLSATRAWLAKASVKYEGDTIDAPLRDEAALDRLLGRSAVYVRGPTGAFATGSRLAEVAADSVSDAFIACLLAPPGSRDEKTMLSQVEAAYRTSPSAGSDAPQVYRLHDVIAAQPFIEGDWLDQIRNAGSVGEINELRTMMERAQLARAVPATQAEILIYLLDEPKKPGTVTDLDGATDHFLRLGVVDLTASQVVLRLRRHVEPSWVSKAKRVYLARGLVACRLAFDLRQELKPAETD
jgi:hypothetical protein